MKFTVLLYLLLCGSHYFFAQKTYTIDIPADRYQVDIENKLIVCSFNVTQVPNLSGFDVVNIQLGDATYIFDKTPLVADYQSAYNVQNNGESFVLYFSNIPVISIQSEQEIVNEPKRPSHFTYTDLTTISKSFAGIEFRGAFSQTFPKKTYDLEFWEDESGKDSRNMQFGDLREDDDWILDALYNEPLRLRAFGAHNLWLDMHKPYYLEDEEDAKSGVDVMYAELFINGSYNGLYLLSEQIDRKLIQAKKPKDDKRRGELYKMVLWVIGFSNQKDVEIPEFDNNSPIWRGGFEWEYPDESELIDWQEVFNLTDLIINADDEAFNSEIPKLLDINNSIDYFIFSNLLSARDNQRGNLYMARYKADEPYFFVPWDLDATFGNNFKGENERSDILFTNRLTDRLFNLKPTPENRQAVKRRYAELRSTLLNKDALIDRLTTTYNFLTTHKLYEREALVWDNYDYSDPSLKLYLDNWIDDRLEFLDNNLEFKTLSTLDSQIDDRSLLTVYPNPVKDQLFLKNSNGMLGATYFIRDLQGATISSGKLTADQSTIDFSSYASGMYFLSTNSSDIVQKVIKI